MKRNIITTTTVIGVLALAAVFFILGRVSGQPQLASISEPVDSSDKELYVFPITGPNYIPILDSTVPKPQVSAKSALVYDTRSSRMLYEKNTSERLPIASLTKVMTAVIALERLNQEDIITIGGESIKVDEEKQDLYLGEKISLQNLLKLMLIKSSNDAAYAIANHADQRGLNFVSEMNTKAGALGMGETLFKDPAGLDDSGYSTASDLIKLVEYSLNYQEIWDISAEKTAIIESYDSKIKHNVTTTNRLLGFLSDIIGGKTGRTEGALECLILITAVTDYPSKLISIVLGSNDRFGDTQKLTDWTKRAYRWK